MSPSRANTGTTTGLSYDGMAHFFRARFKTFDLPLVRDAVVIGREAPANLDTLLLTLRTVATEPLTGFSVTDDLVAAIIVREALLRKLPRGLFEQFVLQKVKPFMAPSEILRLDLDLEIVIEANV